MPRMAVGLHRFGVVQVITGRFPLREAREGTQSVAPAARRGAGTRLKSEKIARRVTRREAFGRRARVRLDVSWTSSRSVDVVEKAEGDFGVGAQLLRPVQ